MKRLVIAAATLLLVLTGCGSEQQTAATQVPELSARLDSIDAAVTAQRYRAARDRIDDLVDATMAAREAGQLDRSTADRILAAAVQLRSSLPVIVPSTTLTPSPTPEPKPAPKAGDNSPGKKNDRPGKGRGKGNKGDD